jgi:2-octaprenyl-6-methoxyphenol hydroxylase
VVDRRSLLATFLDALTQSSKVDIIENDYIKDIEIENSKDDYIISKIESGKTIESNYLIVSDGIDSRIKNILNIDSEIIDYSQSSYIYNAKADFEENAAIQIFNKHGIFAAIPYEKDYLSIVLSLDKKFEEKYFNDSKPNEDSIRAVFKKYIKNISNFEFVSKYSLVTSRAKNIIKDNILLLGNSSQLLHPVGAQGFNLALRNLETLLNCIEMDSDFSNVSGLIDSDRKSAFSNVDYATNIFASDMLLSKIITFTTYNLLKSSPALKTKFLEKILGLEGYPYLSIGTK